MCVCREPRLYAHFRYNVLFLIRAVAELNALTSVVYNSTFISLWFRVSNQFTLNKQPARQSSRFCDDRHRQIGTHSNLLAAVNSPSCARDHTTTATSESILMSHTVCGDFFLLVCCLFVCLLLLAAAAGRLRFVGHCECTITNNCEHTGIV